MSAISFAKIAPMTNPNPQLIQQATKEINVTIIIAFPGVLIRLAMEVKNFLKMGCSLIRVQP